MTTTNTDNTGAARHEHFDAILPAGGLIEGAFAQQAGTVVKALIQLNGQSILRRVIQALRGTGRVGRIVVVGPPDALAEAQNAGADMTLDEGASGPDNILRGLKLLDTTQRVLIVTTDLPFLTPDALNTFFDACPTDADIALPAMTQAEFEARFPGTHNAYVRLRDGQFTMGCAFVVAPRTLLQNEAHLRALFAARKSQWQMVRLIGLGTGLRFATGRLSITGLEARAGQIARCRGKAILHMPPELAYDIDELEEFLYAREHADLLPALPERAVDRVQEIAP